jgi:hypothetical protein
MASGSGDALGTPATTDPGAFAFKIFLNYDGNGNQFGGTGVSATLSSDPDTLSIFAAQRVDSALTVLVLNKTTGAISDSISLANFTPAGTAQVWQYSQANLAAIVRQTADINVERQQPHRHVSGVFDDAAGDSAGAERHERAAAGGLRGHQRRFVRCNRRLARTRS